MKLLSGFTNNNRRFWVTFALCLIGTLFAAWFTNLTSDGTGVINNFIESVSARSSNMIDGATNGLPLGFSFVTGMISSVNPCGFALLPAYLGLFLGEDRTIPSRSTSVTRLKRALTVSITVTAGFIILFGITGTAITYGTRSIVELFPWAGLLIGVALIGLGVRLVTGGTYSFRLGGKIATRVDFRGRIGIINYFMFGISYGIVSLSCTLPIFLVVVGTAVNEEGILNSATQFALYGLGAGTVVTALTIALALFKEAIVEGLRRSSRHVNSIGSWLLLIAGAYVTYYWLTLGQMLDHLTP